MTHSWTSPSPATASLSRVSCTSSLNLKSRRVLAGKEPTRASLTGVFSETALSLRLAGSLPAQSGSASRAGIYRAHGLRVNPRLRMLKTVYKANIDIIHVQRDETSSLFSVSERLSAGADSQPESQPDDPMGIDSVRPSRKGPL